jgi:hypothetical protein
LPNLCFLKRGGGVNQTTDHPIKFPCGGFSPPGASSLLKFYHCRGDAHEHGTITLVANSERKHLFKRLEQVERGRRKIYQTKPALPKKFFPWSQKDLMGFRKLCVFKHFASWGMFWSRGHPPEIRQGPAKGFSKFAGHELNTKFRKAASKNALRAQPSSVQRTGSQKGYRGTLNGVRVREHRRGCCLVCSSRKQQLGSGIWLRGKSPLIVVGFVHFCGGSYLCRYLLGPNQD